MQTLLINTDNVAASKNVLCVITEKFINFIISIVTNIFKYTPTEGTKNLLIYVSPKIMNIFMTKFFINLSYYFVFVTSINC